MKSKEEGLVNITPVEDVVRIADTLQAPARLNRLLSLNNATKGVNALSRRFAHTDVKFPDMSKYRRESTLDPEKSARDTEDKRRALQHTVYYGAGGVMSLWAAKEMVQGIVYFKGMAADQVALAHTEVDMNEIPEGQTRTYEWRGKPVFVKHRTRNEIA
ncbi:Ubiquinol cytochrome reductase transmembrane region, partial [Ancylostoma duodenale]